MFIVREVTGKIKWNDLACDRTKSR